MFNFKKTKSLSLLAIAFSFILTGCNDENTKQFYGTWVQIETEDPITITITEDNGNKVNAVTDIGFKKLNKTYLVEKNNLIEPMINQTVFTLKDGFLVNLKSNGKTKYKKE